MNPLAFLLPSAAAALTWALWTRREKLRELRKRTARATRLFVSGLPRNGRGIKRKLAQIFRKYSSKRCKIKVAFNSLNQCLGYAYVNVDMADKAIEDVNLKVEIDGNILQVSRPSGKRDTLFQNLPYSKRKKLKLDSVALFSVTDMNTAEEINELLSVLCRVGGAQKRSQKDAQFSIGITDACACVGGNTLAFAKLFHHVNAIEIDSVRASYLKHNVETVCGFHNVSVHCGDFCNLYKALPRQNIIFFDPPWGGTNYTTNYCKANVEKSGVSVENDLPLGSMPLADLCEAVRDHCDAVVARVPKFYDVASFCRKMTKDGGATDRPLPFLFQLGSKATLLVVCFPPETGKKSGLQFGDVKLDLLIAKWKELDPKAKRYKAKFFDFECSKGHGDFVRFGAWHGV